MLYVDFYSEDDYGCVRYRESLIVDTIEEIDDIMNFNGYCLAIDENCNKYHY